MADAWAEFKAFKETQLDTGKKTSATLWYPRPLNGDLYDPHVISRAWHLWKLEG